MASINELLTKNHDITAILAIAVFSLLLLCITYRWILHPSASIPGPPMARLSGLWLVKNDISGQGCRNLLSVHKEYGDIVRIGPNEVSFNSQEAYDYMYSQQTKIRKSDVFYYGLLPKEVITIFTTTDTSMHSALKRLFTHGFSRSNILRFEPTIQENVGLAMSLLQSYVDANRPVPLYKLATGFTLDTISHISFGERVGALDRPEIDDPLSDMLGRVFRETLPLLRTHFSFLHRLVTHKNVGEFSRFMNIIFRCVKTAEDNGAKESLVKDAIRRAKEAGYQLESSTRVSLMSQIVTAGYGTTAIAICGTIQRTMRTPKVYKRVHEELHAAWPDINSALTITELERLPYFEACIKEGLRMSCPAPVRMPRIVGPEGYRYRDYYIPPGTTISSSNYFFCYDQTKFPDPYTFNPDRWLSENSNVSQTNNNWMIFSKGIRSCIGIHMALAELKVFVAHFVRKFALDEFVDDFKMSEWLVAESDTPMRMRLVNW